MADPLQRRGNRRCSRASSRNRPRIVDNRNRYIRRSPSHLSNQVLSCGIAECPSGSELQPITQRDSWVCGLDCNRTQRSVRYRQRSHSNLPRKYRGYGRSARRIPDRRAE